LAFKEKMHQRAAVEESISELVRGHGLRRSRRQPLDSDPPQQE
jgi:hypothetical protein